MQRINAKTTNMVDLGRNKRPKSGNNRDYSRFWPLRSLQYETPQLGYLLVGFDNNPPFSYANNECNSRDEQATLPLWRGVRGVF